MHNEVCSLSPSTKTLFKHLDPTIMASMTDLSSNPREILVSLLDKSMSEWTHTSC
jgi:hypothetical protein